MPLNFTDAVEIVEQGSSLPTTPTQSVDAATIMSWMEKQAPEIAALMRKDLTVSDVHQTTALGNEKDKPRGSFKERLSTMEGKKPDKIEDGDATEKLLGDIWAKIKSEIAPLVAKELGEAEWSTELKVTKLDDEQRIIYGWASVVEEDGKVIVDKQGDIILPEDLEKAAEDFVLYSRSQGDMHSRKDVGRLVASLVTTKALKDAFGMEVPHDRVGWIVGFKVDSDEVWKRIKSGERPEFSIGGRGQRVEV